MTEQVEQFIVSSLTDLANARECEAAYPSGCKPIIPGVTHCESCGFHVSTRREVVTHRDACSTPEWHTRDWNDSPELWCECGSPVCELA